MARFKNITFFLSLFLASSVLLSACSKKLPAETVPDEPVTAPTVSESVSATEETTETTIEETTKETEPEPKHGPTSTPAVTERVVDVNGQLSVKDGNMVNQDGEIIQLRGMSLYGINHTGDFFNENTCKTLAEDWGCTVIRLAIYTEGSGTDGYIGDPEKYFQVMCEDIDLCIAQGVYCIVDWHILFDGDPNEYKEEALDFFSRISAIYCDCPNVIYEICNEPNGKRFDDDSADVDWKNTIKPYAEEVIETIRANDPDNIIIVGTSTWSQDVDIAAEDPIDAENIMYTLHFYAASHGQDHRDKAQIAIDKGLALFVTEWGTTMDSGGGTVDTEASDEWLAFLDENHIGWCNWSIGGSASESSNALKMKSGVLTPEEKFAGHWPDEFITRSGKYVRCKLLGLEYIPEE